MRIVHLSYAIPKPRFSDPALWLRRISFITGIFEHEAKQVEVIAIYHIHFNGVLKKNSVTYHFTNLRRWQLIIPLSFHRFLSRLDPDVVVVHGLIYPLQILLLRLHFKGKIRIIVQHHAERPFVDFRRYLQRCADRHVSAYLFAAEEIGEQWVNEKQISDRGKIRVIMGTSSVFHPVDKDYCRKQKNIMGNRVFLWVGGLDANKDPMTVVRAFAALAVINREVRLYMIYQKADLLVELLEFLDRHGISDRIILVGEVEKEQLLCWYNAADFIISSSHYEGSGIAVCEALSCGCVPILTRIPSFRMMTKNGSFGYLFEAGNSDQLYEILVKCQSLDIVKLRQEILNWFDEELSFEANAGKILNLISEISPK